MQYTTANLRCTSRKGKGSMGQVIEASHNDWWGAVEHIGLLPEERQLLRRAIQALLDPAHDYPFVNEPQARELIGKIERVVIDERTYFLSLDITGSDEDAGELRLIHVSSIMDELSRQLQVDWTEDPATHRLNSSATYQKLVRAVADILRGHAHDLLGGNTYQVAGFIMAQLAHAHHLAPSPVIVKTAEMGDEGEVRGLFEWRGQTYEYEATPISKEDLAP